jgi:hypothetical protein
MKVIKKNKIAKKKRKYRIEKHRQIKMKETSPSDEIIEK